jgi:hypothetical protein
LTLADIAVTASFNSGEWSPSLFARVDIAKYRSAAALLQNFFVDYRGGASTRAGSQYTIQCLPGINRLIPFQAGFNVGYELLFSNEAIRFIYQGSPVLENSFAIAAATNANPVFINVPSNDYNIGDWLYVSGVGGMTQLNGRYFVIGNIIGGSGIELNDLFGNTVDSTTYGVYTSGGIAQRIYTISSPYAAADLELLKFTQLTTNMVITHNSYPPYELTLITAIDWTLAEISFGSTAATPTASFGGTSLPGIDIYTTPATVGQAWYSYVVTSVDAQGQESLPSNVVDFGPYVDIRTYGGTNRVNWTPVTGAVSYNVYESSISYFGAQPATAYFGFIGTSYGSSFVDDNIGPDFSEGPPNAENPFTGEGVAFITVTAPGTYTTVPGVTLSGGSPATPASASAILTIQGTPTITAGGSGYAIGDTVNFNHGIIMSVTAVSSGAITAWAVSSGGTITSGTVPSNPIAQYQTSGSGTGATMTATWGVGQVVLVTPGLGYTGTPTVGFTSGAATATATLSPTGAGNPGVCTIFQQSLVLAQTPGAPQTFWKSVPGAYFNYNTHNPINASDAVTGTLTSGVLNTIKSIVSVPAGMLILTDKAAWVVNGGYVYQGVAAALTPFAAIAAQQSFIGANDMPPIIANYDILYVESKGSKVRDLSYNIYFNTFTGTDISITASHLFYGYTLTEWAWAEQPFYEVWAVRNDGTMLTLTYLKEQEFIGWSHQVTLGLYKSVSTVTEPSIVAGTIDAVYAIVERVVNSQTVQYVERFAERVFPLGLQDAWCVDSGLQFTGSATLAFQGAEHLSGLTVTGLQTDDQGNVTIIAPFVMPYNGEFTLPAPPSPATGYVQVTLGLAYTCQLQTLPLDLGEPSIQGKSKKIANVDVRVDMTLGLQIGPDFSHLVPMKDLVQGAIGSMLIGQPVQQVGGLFTGDARTFIGPTYTVPGQYCFQQSVPYPATILGVFPSFTIGDDK